MRAQTESCTICLTEIQPYSPAIKLIFDDLPNQEYFVCTACDYGCVGSGGYQRCLEIMAVARANAHGRKVTKDKLMKNLAPKAAESIVV